MFRKYDKDGGGEIDVAEFTALCYDMGFFFQVCTVPTLALHPRIEHLVQ